MNRARIIGSAPPSFDPPDLTTLRVIVAVAESGSMSAGSDRAGLALGAVSGRITALERATGTALFERSNRGVRTTATGQFLVQRARELLAEADRLTLDLHDAARQLQGHVRVMANASSIIEYLPARLAAFQAAHPRIRVEVEERSSPEIPLALLDGSADLGLLDMPYAVQGLDAVDLFSDTLVVVVPAGHALARQRVLDMDALMELPLVCLPDGNAISGRLTCAVWRNQAGTAVFAQNLTATPPANVSGTATTDASGVLTGIFGEIRSLTTGQGGVDGSQYTTTGLTLVAPVAWYANSKNGVFFDSTGGTGNRAIRDASGGVQMTSANWWTPFRVTNTCTATNPPTTVAAPPVTTATPVPTLGEWSLLALGLTAAGLGARRLRRRG